MRLLISIINASNNGNSVLLGNQNCMTKPTLITLHSNEYSYKCHYYPFAFKLDKSVRCCKNLGDLSNEIWVPNKTEDLIKSGFSMITGIKKLKTLTKYI